MGAGTVYRHFPTKSGLFEAVIAHRLDQVVTAGRALLDSAEPGDALASFIRAMALEWGVADRGLAQALTGDGADGAVISAAEGQFMDLLAELLTDAQDAGTVRRDLTPHEAKAIIVACQSVQTHAPDSAERVTSLIISGLAP